MELTNAEKTLAELVRELPEIYQPIFGEDVFTTKASRICQDRALEILSIYRDLRRVKGSELRVLDLGCAQGYFGFRLAELGAIVDGFDYSQENINVCRKLAELNPTLQIKFELKNIEVIVNELCENQYDLVLGLSVFHHLIHEHGLQYVESLFSRLAHCVPAGIFEFALRAEPLYWAESLPENSDYLLARFAFVRQVATYGTHLSEVQRPLYFASNRYACLPDFIEEFEHWTTSSHEADGGFHSGSRRYFFSQKAFIKILDFEGSRGSFNKREYQREADFLSAPPNGFSAPKLFSSGCGDTAGWVVRELVDGKLLSSVISSGAIGDLNSDLIISKLLDELVALESAGKYHGDLRAWNILISPQGLPTIIDYGAISDFIEDGDDLYGQILSFFVLIREIHDKDVRDLKSRRPRFVSPAHFSGWFGSWARLLWAFPAHKWSFDLVRRCYYQSKNDGEILSEDAVKNIEFSGLIESFFSTYSNSHSWRLNSIVDAVRAEGLKHERQLRSISSYMEDRRIWDEEIRSATKNFVTYQQDLESTRQKLKMVTEDLITAQQELDSVRKKFDAIVQMSEDSISLADERRRHIEALYRSLSWRVTMPLRRAAGVILSGKRSAAEMLSLKNKLTESFRVVLVVLVNCGVKHAQKSVRFRRFANSLLRRMPAVLVKIRRVHIESQVASSAIRSDRDLVDMSATPSMQNSFDEYAIVVPIDRSFGDGVDSQRRTPLEARFQEYVRR